MNFTIAVQYYCLSDENSTTYQTTMAPALVETATTTNSGPVPASVYKLDLGQYKEIDLTYIDKDAEAGKTDGPAATVSESISSAFWILPPLAMI